MNLVAAEREPDIRRRVREPDPRNLQTAASAFAPLESDAATRELRLGVSGDFVGVARWPALEFGALRPAYARGVTRLRLVARHHLAHLLEGRRWLCAPDHHHNQKHASHPQTVSMRGAARNLEAAELPLAGAARRLVAHRRRRDARVTARLAHLAGHLIATEHPDKGGTHERAAQLTAAMQEAEGELTARTTP